MNPVATVLSIARTGSVWACRVRFDRLPERPITPANLFWSEAGAPARSCFRLDRLIALERDEATFETDDGQELGTPPAPDPVCMFVSRWGEEQWEIVRAQLREWTLQEFAPGHAIRTRGERGWWMRRLEPGEAVPKGAALVEGGWDHAHCALCWASIGQHEGSQPRGWVCESHWLCLDCHERYLIGQAASRFGDHV